MLVFPRKVSQQITTLKNIPSRRRKCQCSQPTRPTSRPSSHSRPSHPVDKGRKWHRMDVGIGIGPKHVKLHQTPVKCDKIMTYHSNSRLVDQLTQLRSVRTRLKWKCWMVSQCKVSFMEAWDPRTGLTIRETTLVGCSWNSMTENDQPVPGQNR
jgi:hypothetical protein